MTRNAANRLCIASAICSALLLCAFARTTLHCESSASATDTATMNKYATISEVAETPAAEATEASTSDTESDATNDEELNKVRQAARDYLKAGYPDLKSDGVFSLMIYPGELYIAGIDTAQSSGKRRTIDLLVRRYVRKTGGVYWRAESLGPEQAVTYTRMATQNP